MEGEWSHSRPCCLILWKFWVTSEYEPGWATEQFSISQNREKYLYVVNIRTF